MLPASAPLMAIQSGAQTSSSKRLPAVLVFLLLPLSLQYFNPAAFAAPAAGTFGNLARNALYGPGFRSVDLCVCRRR